MQEVLSHYLKKNPTPKNNTLPGTFVLVAISDNYPIKGNGRTMLYTTRETAHSLTLYKK